MATNRSISPIVSFDDLDAGIQMMKDFGFTPSTEYRNDAGEIEHCELSWGDTVVMPAPRSKSGAWIPGPSSLYLSLEDPDAHHAKAVAAGLEVIRPLTDESYGSREYGVRDSSGNVWTFGTYVAGSTASSNEGSGGENDQGLPRVASGDRGGEVTLSGYRESVPASASSVEAAGVEVEALDNQVGSDTPSPPSI